MSKIGIVCASDTELNPFIEQIENRKIIEKAMLKFHVGTIKQKDVVAVYSGVCKVNASIATQLLIDIFQVDVIINAGVAGGMDEDVKLFDTVVAERTAYHDVEEDILTEFHPWLPSIYFQTDERLIQEAKEYSRTSKLPILFGTIVTGEAFIEGKAREEINKKFAPLAVDMETASVAHVCYVNRIPFLSIRTITDTVTKEGIENFEKNCEKASYIAKDVVIGIMDRFL